MSTNNVVNYSGFIINNLFKLRNGTYQLDNILLCRMLLMADKILL